MGEWFLTMWWILRLPPFSEVSSHLPVGIVTWLSVGSYAKSRAADIIVDSIRSDRILKFQLGLNGRVGDFSISYTDCSVV